MIPRLALAHDLTPPLGSEKLQFQISKTMAGEDKEKAEKLAAARKRVS